jgi:hypothetical protein
VVRRCLVSVPLDLLAFTLAVVTLGLVLRGLIYPLWYASDGYRLDWGGPSIAGRWAAHSAVGLAVAAVTVVILAAIARAQARAFGGAR